jgi:hypothetical protein
MEASMSQEEFASVVGKALLDPTFAKALTTDPETAVKSSGAKLTGPELKSLSDISAEHLAQVSSVLRTHLPSEAFFDQNQNQQQAQMD